MGTANNLSIMPSCKYINTKATIINFTYKHSIYRKNSEDPVGHFEMDITFHQRVIRNHGIHKV